MWNKKLQIRCICLTAKTLSQKKTQKGKKWNKTNEPKRIFPLKDSIKPQRLLNSGLRQKREKND